MVASRTDDFDFRGLVRIDHDLDAPGDLISPTGIVGEFKFPFAGLAHGERRKSDQRFVQVGLQFDCLLFLLGNQTGGNNGFVKMKLVGQTGPFHDRESTGVQDHPFGQFGVFRIGQGGVCLNERRILEDLDREGFRSLAVVFNKVLVGALKIRQGGSENGIFQGLYHGYAPDFSLLGGNHGEDLFGDPLRKMRQYGQAVSPFDLGITRINFFKTGDRSTLFTGRG